MYHALRSIQGIDKHIFPVYLPHFVMKLNRHFMPFSYTLNGTLLGAIALECHTKHSGNTILPHTRNFSHRSKMPSHIPITNSVANPAKIRKTFFSVLFYPEMVVFVCFCACFFFFFDVVERLAFSKFTINGFGFYLSIWLNCATIDCIVKTWLPSEPIFRSHI